MPLTFPAGLPQPQEDDLQYTEEPRVRAVSFDDGYEQRAPDGINTTPRTFTVEWPALTVDQKDTLRDFLRSCGGTLAFAWTPPGEGTAVVVTCAKWKVAHASGPYWGVNATFQEEFDHA